MGVGPLTDPRKLGFRDRRPGMLRVTQIQVLPWDGVPGVDAVTPDEPQQTSAEHAGPQPLERGKRSEVEFPDHVLAIDVIGDDLLETANHLPVGIHHAAADEQLGPTLAGGHR